MCHDKKSALGLASASLQAPVELANGWNEQEESFSVAVA